MFGKWTRRRPAGAFGLPRLTLPEPAAGCHPAALVTAAEVKAWLDQLPTLNAARTAELLAAQAVLLSDYPGPLPQLRRILQLAHEPLGVLDRAVAELMRQPGNAAAQRDLAQLVPPYRRLTLALAQLHKRNVNAALDKAAGPSAEDLHACATLLARHLRIELCSHRPLPAQTWRDLLDVHEIGVLLDRAAVRVRHAADEAPDLHTEFFACLLFLLTDAPHLAPAAAWEMFAAARRLAPQCRFEPAPQGQGQRAQCILVDMRGSVPPLALARQPELADPAACRRLSLDQVVRRARQDAAADAATRSLAALLAAALDGHGRTFPRFARSAGYRAYLGLAATQQRLAELAGGPQEPAAPVSPFRPANRGAEPGARWTPCQQVNHSLGGAAFVIDLDPASLPPIGCVALFEAADLADPQRQVGFVGRVKRHVRHVDGHNEIGVEKLGGRTLPVLIAGHKGSGRAVLRQDPAGPELELLAPPGTHQAGAVLQLLAPGGPRRIRLERLEEANPELERIAVSAVAG